MTKHFFLALCALLLLCSCSPKAETQATPSEKTTLTLWHIMNYSGPREVLAEAVQRFEKANPDCTVQIQTFENDAYKLKLAVEMVSGNPPDLLFTWGGGHLFEQVNANKILDLTPYLSQNGWKERFIDAALQLCTSQGHIYAVPIDLSAVLFWYDRQLFQKHQLTPPQTFQELLTFCQQCRRLGLEPCALGNQNQWPGAFYFCYLANRCGGTQLFLDAAADKSLFATQPFVDAGNYLQQLIQAKAFPTGFNGMDDSAARTRFLNGKSASLLMGSWVVARILTEKPEFIDRLGVFPFPTVPNGKGDPSTILGGVNCAFAVSKACKAPEKAVQLLQFLTDDTVVNGWCKIGRIPAFKTTAEQNALLPAPTQEALTALRNAQSLQPYYDQYLPPRMAVKHKETTQNIFANTMSPKQAANEMAK